MTDTIIPGFIQKTYDIFMNDEYKSCCWNQDGTSIIVKDQSHFTKSVLPRYFKHSNFQSFVRQLNMYDFHKVIQDPSNGEFKHQFFKRGRDDLLINIKRKVHLKSQSKKKRKFETSSDDDCESISDDTDYKSHQLVIYNSKLRPNINISNRLRNLENQCQKLEIENIELRNVINDSRHKQQLFFNQMESALQRFYKVCNDANLPLIDSLAKTLSEQHRQLQINDFHSNQNVFDDDLLLIAPDNTTLVRSDSLQDPPLTSFSRLSSLEDWTLIHD